MSHRRTALALTIALSLIAVPAASVDDAATPMWPVAIAWPKTFPVSDAIALVMGDSRMFVVSPTEVSALAWKDGASLWKSSLSATTRPVVDEGRVFVSASDGIHALSEATGEEAWRLTVGKIALSPTAKAGWLIVPGGDGSLQGINASEGREVWRIDLPAALTTPVVIEGDLVIGASEDGIIRGWQIADGAVRWTRELGTRPTQLLAAAGQVFVGGANGRLFSLRHKDGGRNWEYKLEMTIVGRLAADDRHVYATTIDNSVHAHTFNGHRAWHKLLAARVVDGLYSDGGSVYVPQASGEIRIYLAKDGARAGRLSAPSDSATMIGGLVASGAGDRLQMATTVSLGKELLVATYRRTGLAAVPASAAPPGTALLLSLPGGQP